MALLTKEVFENPYVAIGNSSDVCEICRKNMLKEHPELAKDYPWMITMKLRGQLANKKIFKIFQNSNTPLVICEKHLQEILDKIKEEEEE